MSPVIMLRMQRPVDYLYRPSDCVFLRVPRLSFGRRVAAEVIPERRRAADELRCVLIRILILVFRMHVTIRRLEIRQMHLVSLYVVFERFGIDEPGIGRVSRVIVAAQLDGKGLNLSA